MARTPMRERLLAMLGIAAGTGLLAVGLATMPATAAPPESRPWIPDAYAEVYEHWFKVDLEWEVKDFEEDGSLKSSKQLVFTYEDGDYFGPGFAELEDMVFTLSAVTLDEVAKEIHFTWVVTLDGVAFKINVVVVKTGVDMVFHYADGASTGAVNSGQDSVSHVVFGWGKTTDNGNGNGNNGTPPPNGGTTPVIVTVPETTPPETTRQTIPFDEEPATVPPTVLPTIVEPTTTTLAPATVAPATEAPATTEAEVLGVTVDRQLPRTGAASTALAQIGLGLLLVGAGLLAHSRRFAYDER
jgi:LPXTG-motif cell wall-anchored protein